ncbi:CTP synthase (glutamine hydrolyzing) [candidate division WOR-3 bacterium]|nr:CTP synthase (glutamine hydrolyzing) [candidate division WOR-3 bacterium]
MEKYVVVIGGVISGVGKGIAAASIGKILKEYGFSVTAVKIDPYINYDAGTLRPTEHGEVWVTYDGGEIDQDLGNYERFLEIPIPKSNNITTGQIYSSIIEKERKGKYLGETVQFIPHVPDEIKRRIKKAKKGYDICIIEIGGTVGDYENIPFLFAVKSMEKVLGNGNVCYVLITFLPVPDHISEMKTKPTQQAIKLLQENGVIPDIILCRGHKPVDLIRKKKIETYANIKSEYVISAPDIKVLYEVPLNFEKERLGRKLLGKLDISPKKTPNWQRWRKLVTRIKNPETRVTVGIVGKYLEIGDYDLRDSYISINEALTHAGAKLATGVDIQWIDSDAITPRVLSNLDGIMVPGGFGEKGIDGKISAIRYAREQGIPFLGLCLGMQLAVVEFARNVLGLNADSTEFDPETEAPVVDILPYQRKLLKEDRYGGTMRLGAYAAYLKQGTLIYKLYKERLETDRKISIQPERRGKVLADMRYIIEKHRHRYEISPDFVDILEKGGMVFSGFHIPEKGPSLMEFLELPKNRFFVATQSHPEFTSTLISPSPLFVGFLSAMEGE